MQGRNGMSCEFGVWLYSRFFIHMLQVMMCHLVNLNRPGLHVIIWRWESPMTIAKLLRSSLASICLNQFVTPVVSDHSARNLNCSLDRTIWIYNSAIFQAWWHIVIQGTWVKRTQVAWYLMARLLRWSLVIISSNDCVIPVSSPQLIRSMWVGLGSNMVPAQNL